MCCYLTGFVCVRIGLAVVRPLVRFWKFSFRLKKRWNLINWSVSFSLTWRWYLSKMLRRRQTARANRSTKSEKSRAGGTCSQQHDFVKPLPWHPKSQKTIQGTTERRQSPPAARPKNHLLAIGTSRRSILRVWIIARWSEDCFTLS